MDGNVKSLLYNYLTRDFYARQQILFGVYKEYRCILIKCRFTLDIINKITPLLCRNPFIMIPKHLPNIQYLVKCRRAAVVHISPGCDSY